MKSFYIKLFLVFIFSFVLVFVLGASIPWSSLKVFDQPKGTAILIKEVRLAKPGFVAVQVLDQDMQLPVNSGYINNVAYMPKGIYKNITVYLGNQGETPQTRVAVTVYEDTNENKDFDDYFDADINNPAPEGGFDKMVFSKIDGKALRRFIKLY